MTEHRPVTGGESPSVGSLRRAARDAWIYVAPLIEMAATRFNALNPAVPREGLGVNRFQHMRRLSGPKNRLVSAPNNDTLFSSAWIDLTDGPVTLTIPPTGSRYISLALMNMYSDNDAVLGVRTLGEGGGRFTVVGPHQAGGGPHVVRLTTPHGWVLGRTLVDGEPDLPAARAVQDGLGLEGPDSPPPVRYATRHDGWAEVFASAQALLLADPPPATDARRLAALAPLGLDAHGGFDPSRFDADSVAQIEAGIADARAMLPNVDPPARVDGWAYPPPELGAFGQNYLLRASVAVFGLAALPRAEAMYMRPVGEDGQRAVFDGAGDYRLSFAAGQLPPLDGFWSLTMYEVTPEGQTFPTANPIDRHSIGDRTPGLATNPDGSLDIWISRRDPGDGRRSNWLPAPEQGPFSMSFRTYLPRPALLDGRWRLPPLQRA